MLKHKYTKEFLQEIVKTCTTWAEVCRKLGIKPFTGSQTYLKKRCCFFKIDISHFLGRAYRRGKTFPSIRPIEEYLIIGNIGKSHDLKNRLIKEGLKERKCEKCEITEWDGFPAPLELDHQNNNHFDNRLENLKILCSNCHSIRHYKDRLTKKETNKQQKLLKQKEYRPRINKRKVVRPDKNMLQYLLNEKRNWCAIGRQFGVSDNAVRKWARYYNISMPT